MRIGRLVILTFLPIYLQEHLGYSPLGVGFYLYAVWDRNSLTAYVGHSI